MTTTAEAAAVFGRLHEGPDVLLLANCWDAASARLFESIGAKAMATSSAALAWSNGYADGNVMPLDQLVAAVGRITRIIRIPLSVDMEGGYSRDAAGVAESVGQVIDAGGIGCNLEDGRGSVDELCARIEYARKGAARTGVHFWINARTDVFLRGLVPTEQRVAETISRAARYHAAGADSLFVPGLFEAKDIREIAKAIGYPLSVMAWPGLPNATELAKLGVRRLSAGAAINEVLLGNAASLAKAFLSDGRSETLEGGMDFAAINRLFM